MISPASIPSSLHLLPRRPDPLADPRGLLLIAAIAIGATLMAGNFRERALRNSERELENTCCCWPAISTATPGFRGRPEGLISFMRSSGIATQRITSVGCRARKFT